MSELAHELEDFWLLFLCFVMLFCAVELVFA
jgi:hypothetical protein